jgi:integrase
MANLFQRNGNWYVNYRFNGKQCRKSAKTKNRKFAEIALQDLELQLFKGNLVGQKGRRYKEESLNQIVYRYLSYVDENTVPEYGRHVKMYLSKWLNFLNEQDIMKASSINIKTVDDFLVNVLRNRATKTKKEYLASLKACLNRAIKWDLIKENPIRDANISGKTIKKVNFFSKDQIKILWENAPKDLQIAIHILVYTGIRLGELWALRWEDIDFVNSQIWVRAYKGFTPKGKRDRNIPLNNECLELLKELHSQKQNGDIYVYRFCNSPRALSVKFKYYLDRVGFSGRLHDLRHTFASHLVMSGTPLPVVQELLGHAHITTTMVYSHMAPSIHRNEIQRLSF